jgi:hypothetical protein
MGASTAKPLTLTSSLLFAMNVGLKKTTSTALVAINIFALNAYLTLMIFSMNQTLNRQMEKIYWTTKDGVKLDINEMSIEHLRNTLKMIVRNESHLRDFDDRISLQDLEAENYGCR